MKMCTRRVNLTRGGFHVTLVLLCITIRISSRILIVNSTQMFRIIAHWSTVQLTLPICPLWFRAIMIYSTRRSIYTTLSWVPALELEWKSSYKPQNIASSRPAAEPFLHENVDRSIVIIFRKRFLRTAFVMQSRVIRQETDDINADVDELVAGGG